jgi:hypothetical protein
MGGLEHELMIGQTPNTENGEPEGFVVDFFQSAGVEPVVGGEGAEDLVMNMPPADEHTDEEEHMDEGEHMDEEMEDTGDMDMEDTGDMDMEDTGDMEGMDMEEDDMHMHSGWMFSVPATQDEYTITFTVTEDMVGEWEIGCFLLSGDTAHYSLGMTGTLTVLP